MMPLYEHVCITPHYFPCLPVFKKLYQASCITLDIDVPYQKQSYQSRCYIATSQGTQPLIVPIEHKTKYDGLKNVRIDYTTHWYKKHQHALQTAYGQTPYFPFLWDMIQPIIAAKPVFLYELSYKILQAIFSFLQMEKEISLSISAYDGTPREILDLRYVFHPKRGLTIREPMPKYIQQFGGIQVPQLSIFDLLCMQGLYACKLLAQKR